jgi:hypothetical protein
MHVTRKSAGGSEKKKSGMTILEKRAVKREKVAGEKAPKPRKSQR